jgi:hypothetical protein
MRVTTPGIDLATSLCQLHGGDDRGTVALQKSLCSCLVLWIDRARPQHP